MIDPANYNFKIPPRILSKEEILEHSLPLTDSTMNTDIIKETQEHIKRLDDAMVKYDEYVGLLQGTKRLLKRSMEYLQKHMAEPSVQPEDAVVHYVGFKPAEYPLEGLNYKSHDSLHLNADLFKFHKREGELVYGVYDDSPVIVDTTVQVFCHFATFALGGIMPAFDIFQDIWTKSEDVKMYLLSLNLKQQYPITSLPTPLTSSSIVNVTARGLGGLVMYQTRGFQRLYHGTELVESPTGQGFCTKASLQLPTI